jgi:glycerol kinase
MPAGLLAIDQGTTSTRALLFSAAGEPLASARRELPQHFPRDGWVEHEPEQLLADALACAREALAAAGLSPAALRAGAVAAVGVTNQRETVVLWERASGRALHRALVWQDRRTADACERLRAAGHEPRLQQRTGLLLDPYFSATKLAWLLDHVPGARARAERGELLAGTVDAWLLWHLQGGAARGARHLTDATNASRTALFDLSSQRWDDELLALFGVPRALLPLVLDSAADFGATDPGHLGAALPLRGVAGDQQAAAVGQACFAPGQIKGTYGTGAFVLLNSGGQAPLSRNRLLGTVALRLAGAPSFALEGSIFSAGSAVQWLRDGLGIIARSADSEALARRADPARRVHLVPAFTGLGAPHWDAGARGAVLGLTRDATAADLCAAALQATGFQTADLLAAMAADGAPAPAALRVDGGLCDNGYAMQFLADACGVPVERPACAETTALGAALLAGLGAGLFASSAELSARWRAAGRWEPRWTAAERDEQLAGWRAAVARVRTTA